MFSNRDLPFQGDYNWISPALRTDGTVFAYMSWTDKRDVVLGTDRAKRSRTASTSSRTGRRRSRTMWRADNCANAGGLDQNIYGNSAEFPAA
jgi:hypothetical protein